MKKKIKLESGIEPPPRHAYDFARMEKGQSFKVGLDDMARARNAAYAYARRTNRRNARNKSYSPLVFQCRRMDEDTWRIFRVE